MGWVSFESMVLPAGTRRLIEFDGMVRSHFGKGMTTHDIARAPAGQQ